MKANYIIVVLSLAIIGSMLVAVGQAIIWQCLIRRTHDRYAYLQKKTLSSIRSEVLKNRWLSRTARSAIGGLVVVMAVAVFEFGTSFGIHPSLCAFIAMPLGIIIYFLQYCVTWKHIVEYVVRAFEYEYIDSVANNGLHTPSHMPRSDISDDERE